MELPNNTKPISLSEMTAGDTGILLAYRGARLVNHRLVSLGFTPGVRVKMLQNWGRGPLIVAVRGGRIALGRGEATKIFVEHL